MLKAGSAIVVMTIRKDYVTEIYAENMELLTPKRAQERAGEQSVPGVRTDGMADEGSSAGEPAVDESNGLPF